MALPKMKAELKSRTRDVELSDGAVVTVRGLTMLEVEAINKTGKIVAMSIAYATGESVEEVEAFLAERTYGDSQKVCDAIQELSGLGEAARFQG